MKLRWAVEEDGLASLRTEVRSRCQRSLYYFLENFWLEVSQDKFRSNWHIEYICGELMGMAHRIVQWLPKEYDLVINIPPGATKSLTCSVVFPVWCWVNWPWMSFITASYSAALALEQADKSRDLIRSRQFRWFFPEFRIKDDKDQKSNFRIQRAKLDNRGIPIEFENGGNRFSTSIGGTLTGFHGHFLIVDDPLDPNAAVSEKERMTANRWLDQTLSTRAVDKAVTPTVLIMQRLHEDDPSGHLLSSKDKLPIKHICLPGEIKSYQEQIKPAELAAKYVDNLLDPVRMPWPVLQSLEAKLGQYGYAGQIGQNPVPPGGGMFKVEFLENQIVDVVPPQNPVIHTVRYWDNAATADAGSFTCGAKMGQLKGGKWIVLDVKRGQWSTGVREAIKKATAETDGANVFVYTEQEPGSGGKESAEATIRNLAGFSAHADRPTGDKIYRADPYSVQINWGNVMLLKGDWNRAFIDEHRFFPFGKYKDQVDAASGAFAKLVAKKEARPVL